MKLNWKFQGGGRGGGTNQITILGRDMGIFWNHAMEIGAS